MSRICENAIARKKARKFLLDQLKSLRLVGVVQSHVRSCIALRELSVSKTRMAKLRHAASVASSVSMMKVTRLEMRNIVLASRFLQKNARARLCRGEYLRKRHSIVLIQTQTRGLVERLRYRRRLRSVHLFQMAYRMKRIFRINSSRRDATRVVERAMDRYLNRKRLSDWITDMQRAVLSSKLEEMRRVLSCPRPYARLRPLLKEKIPNTDRAYNSLINLRDRDFFDSFLHLAIGLPNALSVARWLISEGADPEGRNFKGSTVFHDAIFLGDCGLDLTRYLLTKCKVFVFQLFETRTLLFVTYLSLIPFLQQRQRQVQRKAKSIQTFSLSCPSNVNDFEQVMNVECILRILNSQQEA